MIDTLNDVARFVIREPLTAEDVIHQFGAIITDHGRGGSLELASTDPRFTRVQLWRDVGSGAPYLLELELAPTARVNVTEVSAAFGVAADVTPSALESQPALLFYDIAKGTAFDVSLIVLTDASRELVTTVVFRRDIHLPPEPS
jgi:hypothetical protein